jgi:antitoxin CcdA
MRSSDDGIKASVALIYRNVIPDCMTELVSVRVDKETKELISKLGINVSETVRRALQEEIRRRREEELTQGLKKAKLILGKVSDQNIVRTVRESRDRR